MKSKSIENYYKRQKAIIDNVVDEHLSELDSIVSKNLEVKVSYSFWDVWGFKLLYTFLLAVVFLFSALYIDTSLRSLFFIKMGIYKENNTPVIKDIKTSLGESKNSTTKVEISLSKPLAQDQVLNNLVDVNTSKSYNVRYIAGQKPRLLIIFNEPVDKDLLKIKIKPGLKFADNSIVTKDTDLIVPVQEVIVPLYLNNTYIARNSVFKFWTDKNCDKQLKPEITIKPDINVDITCKNNIITIIPHEAFNAGTEYKIKVYDKEFKYKVSDIFLNSNSKLPIAFVYDSAVINAQKYLNSNTLFNYLEKLNETPNSFRTVSLYPSDLTNIEQVLRSFNFNSIELSTPKYVFKFGDDASKFINTLEPGVYIMKTTTLINKHLSEEKRIVTILNIGINALYNSNDSILNIWVQSKDSGKAIANCSVRVYFKTNDGVVSKDLTTDNLGFVKLEVPPSNSYLILAYKNKEYALYEYQVDKGPKVDNLLKLQMLSSIDSSSGVYFNNQLKQYIYFITNKPKFNPGDVVDFAVSIRNTQNVALPSGTEVKLKVYYDLDAEEIIGQMSKRQYILNKIVNIDNVLGVISDSFVIPQNITNNIFIEVLKDNQEIFKLPIKIYVPSSNEKQFKLQGFYDSVLTSVDGDLRIKGQIIDKTQKLYTNYPVQVEVTASSVDLKTCPLKLDTETLKNCAKPGKLKKSFYFNKTSDENGLVKVSMKIANLIPFAGAIVETKVLDSNTQQLLYSAKYYWIKKPILRLSADSYFIQDPGQSTDIKLETYFPGSKVDNIGAVEVVRKYPIRLKTKEGHWLQEDSYQIIAEKTGFKNNLKLHLGVLEYGEYIMNVYKKGILTSSFTIGNVVGGPLNTEPSILLSKNNVKVGETLRYGISSYKGDVLLTLQSSRLLSWRNINLGPGYTSELKVTKEMFPLLRICASYYQSNKSIHECKEVKVTFDNKPTVSKIDLQHLNLAEDSFLLLRSNPLMNVLSNEASHIYLLSKTNKDVLKDNIKTSSSIEGFSITPLNQYKFVKNVYPYNSPVINVKVNLQDSYSQSSKIKFNVNIDNEGNQAFKGQLTVKCVNCSKSDDSINVVSVDGLSYINVPINLSIDHGSKITTRKIEVTLQDIKKNIVFTKEYLTDIAPKGDFSEWMLINEDTLFEMKGSTYIRRDKDLSGFVTNIQKESEEVTNYTSAMDDFLNATLPDEWLKALLKLSKVNKENAFVIAWSNRNKEYTDAQRVKLAYILYETGNIDQAISLITSIKCTNLQTVDKILLSKIIKDNSVDLPKTCQVKGLIKTFDTWLATALKERSFQECDDLNLSTKDTMVKIAQDMYVKIKAESLLKCNNKGTAIIRTFTLNNNTDETQQAE